MRILKVEPGKQAYEKEIDNTLESLQEEVGGLIQPIYMGDGTILCCNDEGKLLGMDMNRRLGNDIICGPFFVAGDGDTDFISLTDAQVTEYQELFGNPEQFREYEPDAQPRAWIISF